MSNCHGQRKNYNMTCNSSIYKCKKCGNVGCNQPSEGDCSQQGFRNGSCVKCGSGDKQSV